jgi:hypothetical protein
VPVAASKRTRSDVPVAGMSDPDLRALLSTLDPKARATTSAAS